MRNEIYQYVYFNEKIINYCKSISKNWEELKSELLIQLTKMNYNKLVNAYNNGYIEYLCFMICKRIKLGTIAKTGIFRQSEFVKLNNNILYENNNDEFSIDIDDFNKIINTLNWYDKALFDLFYIKKMTLKEISEKVGINPKTIYSSISKSKLYIKNEIKKYDIN